MSSLIYKVLLKFKLKNQYVKKYFVTDLTCYSFNPGDKKGKLPVQKQGGMVMDFATKVVGAGSRPLLVLWVYIFLKITTHPLPPVSSPPSSAPRTPPY